VALAPREFDVQARNPANSVHIGGDEMVFSAVYGSPFVREGDVRRDATLSDFRRVGHGGHFLGAAQTMERFRECFYRPLLSSTANYEPPPLDDSIRAELEDYVARRRAQLGD
jgi:trimethylamine:corrinoid methyltransferase-like protein